MEFGPVTFPAYADATAGVRSLTDRFLFDAIERDPSRARELFETARAAQLSDAATRAPRTTCPAPRRNAPRTRSPSKTWPKVPQDEWEKACGSPGSERVPLRRGADEPPEGREGPAGRAEPGVRRVCRSRTRPATSSPASRSRTRRSTGASGARGAQARSSRISATRGRASSGSTTGRSASRRRSSVTSTTCPTRGTGSSTRSGRTCCTATTRCGRSRSRRSRTSAGRPTTRSAATSSGC
jgi:hypothetical protein